MPSNSKTEVRSGLYLTLAVLVLITALIFVPSYFRSKASTNGKGLSSLRTESFDPDLPNYDIRQDKSSFNKIAAFRGGVSKNAVQVADIRDQFVTGEKELASRVPTLKVEYNPDIRIPEVIAPDVKQGSALLTAPSGEKHSDILLNFLRQNTALTGVSSAQIDQLKVFSDYTNPAGNLSFVEIDQEINGVPVFRGEIKAAFTKRGEMARVINNLAPGLDYTSLSMDFRDPSDAVRAAAGFINHQLTPGENALNKAESTDLKAVFGSGDRATTAEKMYFPTEPGVAVPAWRVLIWQPVNAYYVVIDAETGTMLWRKNIAADQTQAATYNVYTGDSPSPLSPTNALPGSGIQGASVSRVDVTVIGNEAPNPGQNNLGWITDGNNTTDGNNVQAGVDLGAPDGVDAPVTGSPNRVFSFAYNPPPAGADAPSGAAYRNGIVTNLFYWTNRYHDTLYSFGFTEPARNFQNDNFGRGGVGGDRVSAEAQDSSGTNNANFFTPADGGRGIMQMYLFTSPNPQRDGSLDADVFLHEMTHGTSNRLVGNGAGLGNIRGAGMGEGWSDFYGRSILSTADEDVNAVYAMGGYVTLNFQTIGTNNYYYGIRRFPYAVKTNAGANGKPHNPLTLADIDPAQINTTDGAFPQTGWLVGSPANEVHNEGEVWCMMLLEVRARIITRMGWAAGNARALQIVTDGLKLTPLSPNFVQARDAIVAADVAGFGGADLADIWAGFATRGNGFSAVDGGTAVTQAFDLPNITQTAPLTIDDSTGNHNGVAEPGELITLNIPFNNNTGQTATSVSFQLVGGGSANLGAFPSGFVALAQLQYLVPAATPCGTALQVTINVNSSLGPTSFVRTIVVGAPSLTASQNFDGVTAPNLPAGWTSTSVLGGANFTTVTTNVDSAPNSAFAPDSSVAATEADLTSPVFPITSGAATLSFRNRYDTEPAWDGSVLEIKIGAGAFTDIIAAGGAFVSNGYNGVMTAAAPTTGYTPNPLNGRTGWTGNSNGFVTTVVRLPASANGQNVQFKWRAGSDDNTTGAGANPGVYIDSLQVFGASTCSSLTAPVKSRADFDGDGKTDLSVFRPSDGNWYAFKSAGGVGITNWGSATDTLVPGDYDNDGKADTAVYRASTGQWFILRSSDSTVNILSFGIAGDVPVAGDYDGDGKTDEGIYRPSAGQWYAFRSSDGTTSITTWGNATDVPVQGDYDNDGRTDVAVYRPSNGQWFVFRSTAGPLVATWGIPGDKPVEADYDGDSKDDLAVFRPSDGNWYIFRSSDNAVQIVNWGNSTDVPVPGDYDGDGKDDEAVYRNGQWFVFQSTAGPMIANWGVAGDTPVPAKYIP